MIVSFWTVRAFCSSSFGSFSRFVFVLTSPRFEVLACFAVRSPLSRSTSWRNGVHPEGSAGPARLAAAPVGVLSRDLSSGDPDPHPEDASVSELVTIRASLTVRRRLRTNDDVPLRGACAFVKATFDDGPELSAAAELDVFFLAFIASSHALMASSTDGSTSRGPPGQFMSADLFASGFPDTRLGSETEPPPPPPLPPLLLAFSH
mmetsp:Transcript_9001/g.19060  ORF Transcript_9001/g.19060 Transcript_9001/m.19060 type:complete len:205 (+) Transcript_9001:534-1148(+)